MTYKYRPFINFILNLFSGENLTKKASLNGLSSILDYSTQLVVGFIITPFLLVNFGNYFYGVWQIINRLFGLISSNAASSSPIEFTLANEQQIENHEQKRQYIGAAVFIWGILLPITGILGGLIAWYLPYWVDTIPDQYWTIRIVGLIFILTTGISTLSFLPYAFLRGQNQAYRRLGLSAIIIGINGFITWLALYLETGIIGVSISLIIQGIITGCFYLFLCKKYLPWFGVNRPSTNLIKNFFKLGWMYLANDLFNSITLSSDVIILGLLKSVELVPSYTLTKYIPETMITIIAILVVGTVPGLGGIIGSGETKRAVEIRGEIFSIIWLIMITMGITILLWNRLFLDLWVGTGQFAGTIQNLLIVIVVFQFILIRTDGSIIDLTLSLRKKTQFQLISTIISIVISVFFVVYLNMGIIGVTLGLILGRSILTIAFPLILNNFFNIPFLNQIKCIQRQLFFTILLFSFASVADYFDFFTHISGIYGWIILFLGVIVTLIIIFSGAFLFGLSKIQKRKIYSRFQLIFS